MRSWSRSCGRTRRSGRSRRSRTGCSRGWASSGCSDGSGWGADLHERLLNYQTPSHGDCTPTGTTGEWHAATGSSKGWQDWEIDLSRFAGQKVEVAIVQASDWAFQNLGAWVDDATVEVGGATSSQTSFEADQGVWQVGGAPASTPNPGPQWTRSTEQFQEGAVVGTTDSVYAGFEVATMNTAAERASFVQASLRHLGILP